MIENCQWDERGRYQHTLQLPDGEWELQVAGAHGNSGTTAFGGVAIAAPAAASASAGRRLLWLLGDPSLPRVQRIRRSLLREPGSHAHAAATPPALVDQVGGLVALACVHTQVYVTPEAYILTHRAHASTANEWKSLMLWCEVVGSHGSRGAGACCRHQACPRPAYGRRTCRTRR